MGRIWGLTMTILQHLKSQIYKSLESMSLDQLYQSLSFKIKVNVSLLISGPSSIFITCQYVKMNIKIGNVKPQVLSHTDFIRNSSHINYLLLPDSNIRTKVLE